MANMLHRFASLQPTKRSTFSTNVLPIAFALSSFHPLLQLDNRQYHY